MDTSIPSPLPPASETVLPMYIAATTPFAVLALITFALRLYTRIGSSTLFRWDDAFMAAAMTCSFTVWVLQISIYVATGGHHIWYIQPKTIMYALHVSFPIWPLSIWGVIFVKISVALMLLRIKQTKTWRIGMAALIGSLVVVGIVATILQILQCRPIQAYWDFTIEAHCMSPKFIHASSYVYNTFFVLTDFICALLPISFIRVINRPLRERVVLSALMAMGLFAGAAGLAKIVNINVVKVSSDIFYKDTMVGVWTDLEAFIGIIAACAPCLRAFLETGMRRLGFQLTSMNSRSPRTYQSGRDYAKQDDYELPGSEQSGKDTAFIIRPVDDLEK